MARGRVLPIQVAPWVLAVTVACVPMCNWHWFPFGGGGDCRTRLDDDTLDRLTLSIGPTVEMEPGGDAPVVPGGGGVLLLLRAG